MTTKYTEDPDPALVVLQCDFVLRKEPCYYIE